MHQITRNRGKEPIIPDDVDTPTDDELSSINSPSLSLSPAKDARESRKARSSKRPSYHPAFSDSVSGVSRRGRREERRRQNQPDQALRNALVLPVGTMPPVLPVGLMPPVLPASTMTLVLPTGMMPPMPLIHLAFGSGPTFYIPLVALIRKPDDMLSSPLGQHILN